MRIVSAKARQQGVDCLSVLSASVCAELVAAGFTFVVRYLENLTSTEVQTILASGLGLMLVSESRAPGWLPSAALGSADGLRVVTRCRALGVPSGMDVWCDCETMGGTPADTAVYVAAWCTAVKAAGIHGKGYMGAGVGGNPVATPAQLFAYPFTGYWHSLSEVPNVAECGYQMIQLYPGNQPFGATGIPVDYDVVQSDKFGRYPLMLMAA